LNPLNPFKPDAAWPSRRIQTHSMLGNQSLCACIARIISSGAEGEGGVVPVANSENQNPAQELGKPGDPAVLLALQ
jgi:hypothetical protein